jgi:lipopolysaccharide transport system ATP-binding protein
MLYGLKDISKELLSASTLFGKRDCNQDPELALRPKEFWALRGVDFTLNQGECLGIIGRNGAGKTTLLKSLNGLIKPDVGSIRTYGSVRALIALGAGFNPILSGRENIMIQASILGLTNKQINSAIDDIVSFADIGDFIDSPVQAYSSGMQVRLGFAIASQWPADIMLLDEVLAVGDVNFRSKCYNKLGTLKKSGSSFILVSHDMSAIAQFCDRCMFLSNGVVKYLGPPSQAIALYENESADQSLQIDSKSYMSTPNVTNVELKTLPHPEGNQREWQLYSPGEFIIHLSDSYTSYLQVSFILRGQSLNGDSVTSKGSCNVKPKVLANQDGCQLVVRTSAITLPPGTYHFKFGIWKTSFEMVAMVESFTFTITPDEDYQGGCTHFQNLYDGLGESRPDLSPMQQSHTL